jgi:chromosomal replication initiation ATPase DnaA
MSQRARENEEAMRRRVQRRAEYVRRHNTDLALIRTVACAHDITSAELLRGQQFRRVVDARMELSLRFRARGMSLLEISHVTGWHHTTVLNHLRRAEKTRPRYKNVLSIEASVIPCPDLSGEWAI